MYNLFVVYHKQKTKRHEVSLDNFTQEEKDIEQTSAPLSFGAQEGEDIEFDENIDIEDIQKILQKHMDESAAQEAAASAEAEAQERSITFDEEESSQLETEAEQLYDDEDEDEEEETFSTEAPNIDNDEIFSQIALQVSQEQVVAVEAQAKKYVIYIEPENIEFIEQLSIAERKAIINKILAEQDIRVKKHNREEEIKQYLRHAIVVTLTLLIGFPLLFNLVNKSLELTVANYERAQRNFSSLYREQGKIKQQNASETESIKY